MLEYKQNLDARVAVRLLDLSGNPVVGAGYGTISATIEKSDGTTVNMTMSALNWIEVTSGAFNGLGKYDLVIPASMVNTTGILVFAVTGPSSSKFIGVCKIVANEEADTYAKVARIQVLKEGRWKTFTSGPDANRLVLYAADGTTVLQKWDLKNSAGTASTNDVSERIPVLSIP